MARTLDEAAPKKRARKSPPHRAGRFQANTVCNRQFERHSFSFSFSGPHTFMAAPLARSKLQAARGQNWPNSCSLARPAGHLCARVLLRHFVENFTRQMGGNKKGQPAT